MTDAIATVGSDKLGIYEPNSVEQAVKLAKYLASSDLVPKDYKGKEANCMIAMIWSKGLGIPYIQGMQNIAVINGKPSIYGDLMTALILNSGKCEALDFEIKGEGDSRVAHATGKRVGMKKEVTKTFSVAEAKEAGLWGKDNWKKYPNDMLGWRAKARLYRSLWADVLMGLGMTEETQDYTPPKGQPVDVTPDPAPVVDEAPEQGEVPSEEKPEITHIPSHTEDKKEEAIETEEADDDGSEAEVVDVEHAPEVDPGEAEVQAPAPASSGAAPAEVVDGMKKAVTNNRRYGWSITKVETKWGRKMAEMSTQELKALADIMRDCGSDKEKVSALLDTAPFGTSDESTGSSETEEESTSQEQTRPTPPTVPSPDGPINGDNPAFSKEMVVAEIDNLIKVATERGVDVKKELGVPNNWNKMKYELEESSLVDFRDDIKGYLG